MNAAKKCSSTVIYDKFRVRSETNAVGFSLFHSIVNVPTRILKIVSNFMSLEATLKLKQLQSKLKMSDGMTMSHWNFSSVLPNPMEFINRAIWSN